jgi:hypothetical protein
MLNCFCALTHRLFPVILLFDWIFQSLIRSEAQSFCFQYHHDPSSKSRRMSSLSNKQRWSNILFGYSTESSFNKYSNSTLKKVSSCSRKKLYPFEEARRLARGHGFSSVDEFFAYDCPGVYQVPKNSPDLYPSQWISWEDFLGLPLDFKTASEKVKSFNWKSKQEYMSRLTPDARGKKAGIDDESHWIYQLPYQPDLYYKEHWISWEHFLGL